MKKSVLLMVVVLCLCFCGCSAVEVNTEQPYDAASSYVVSREESKPVVYLEGDEYDRVNRLLECKEDEFYQFTAGGQEVRYAFRNGSFAGVITIGTTQVQNNGEYKITAETVELFFQNGTHQSWPYEIKNGEMYLTNPNAD